MTRLMRAALLVGCTAIIFLTGCRFFGIDNRPGIIYLHEKKYHKADYKEEMFVRPMLGTDFLKLWPQRLGRAYGYASWEREQAIADGVLPPDDEGGEVLRAESGPAAPPKGTRAVASGKREPVRVAGNVSDRKTPASQARSREKSKSITTTGHRQRPSGRPSPRAVQRGQSRASAQAEPEPLLENEADGFDAPADEDALLKELEQAKREFPMLP